MRPQRAISEKQKEELAFQLKKAKTKDDFQRVQCLWLRATKGFTSGAVAQATGLSEGYVRKVWADYFQEGSQALLRPSRGGRHRQNLTKEQESHLLKGFLDRAEAGGVLVVSQIKQAYEKMVGRTVPKSTVYRMLDRHGWRKILPRPRHPKNDPAAAEIFKKNSELISKRKPQSKPKSAAKSD